MPFDINPSTGITAPTISTDIFSTPSWKWLTQQDYNPERIWQNQLQTRRGTITGGPTYQRILEFGNEQQFAVFKPRPVLTAPILADEQQFYRRQLGAIEWDSIDPYATTDQIAQQADLVTGTDPLAFLKGAQDFFASKGVDIMGMGSTGAPARAADYALAFPIAVFQKLTGARSSPVGASPLPQDDIYFKFRADPRYWSAIKAATPEQLDQLARVTANQYVDPAANGYLTGLIRQQFDTDRNKLTALTSGNPAVDYQAIKRAATGIPGAGVVIGSLGPGFTKIPVIGTQLAELLDPITADERATWAAMEPDARLELLNRFQMTQMASDFVGALPALSGLGSMIAIARGGGLAARTLASTYDWTLRAGGYMMTAGLAAATTNWALEAINPNLPGIGAYREFGAEVDNARPISGSNLAGIVNLIGYWSSGTYGASNIIRGVARGVAAGREANLAVRTTAALDHGLPVPQAGIPEMPIYRDSFGGARMDGILTTAGLEPGLLQLSKKRVVMSEAVHVSNQPYIDTFKAAVDGELTGRSEIDLLPPEERAAAAQNDLQSNVGTMHSTAELYMQVLALAQKPAQLFRSDEGLAMYRFAKDAARTIDNEIARRFAGEYGPGWVNRVAGAFTEDAMRAHVEKSIDRLGGDSSQLAGIHGTEGWAQAMRAVHQYEFDFRNSQLDAALHEPGLSGDIPNEAGKISLVSSYHLFHDEAEAAIAVLRSEDLAAAKAEVEHLVATTKEAEEWFSSRWRPPKGSAREVHLVEPEEMAKWLEDVSPTLMVRRGKPDVNISTADMPLNRFHLKLREDGVWDLAFKPVDADGNFVSYVHTRGGHVFQTPWLEYPLGNVDNIQMGNRGIAMRKFDAVGRGFRTYRIAEFQRASLYRNLTSRFPGMTSAQIDAFHEGLLVLARKFNVQPQTLGTVAQGIPGIGQAYREAIDELAGRTFGAGPYLSGTGERIAVDWRKEIARGYRQSLKLNFTAGATSQMKSRFGSIGASVAWGADIGYVLFRFGLSPLFHAGEIVESRMFNLMAGVGPGTDPWVDAVMYKIGFGNDPGPLATEMTFDQTLQGLNMLDPKLNTGRARQARNYVFQARTAPETMADKAAAAEVQARVEAFHAFTQGGNSIYASPRHALEVELAGLTDEFGNILPGNEARADEISRVLTGQLRPDEVNAMHHVGPEFPDETWSTDPGDLGRNTTRNQEGLPDGVDPDALPEDRGLWHATTNVDGVMGAGLKSKAELDAATGLGGAMRPRVSLTTDYGHADAIRERLIVAVRAARNEATPAELVDYWLSLLDESGMDAFGDVRHEAAQAMFDTGPGRIDEAFAAINHTINEQELVAELDKYMTTGTVKYEFVKRMDATLGFADGEGFSRDHRVMLVGTADQVARADPTQIGIVQVGIKKGAQWTPGTDNFEVQMASKDLWVLDHRILDHPLKTDREGLLAQLNQTVHEDGTVIPGFEAYHQRVLDALEAVDAAAKPPGELRPSDFRSATADYPHFANAEYVPTVTIAPFVEHDREIVQGARPPGYLDAFEQHVRERLAAGLPAFEEPVIISFDPGLNMASIGDGNHRIAIAKRMHLEEVPARVSVDQWRPIYRPGDYQPQHSYHPLPDEPMLKANIDGYIPADARPSQIFSQRVDTVNKIEDVFGTPEHFNTVVEEQAPDLYKHSPYDDPRWWRRAWMELKNPVPGKEKLAGEYRIEKLRRDFPALLQVAGLDDVGKVLGRELGLPKRDWLPFLMEDRLLATDFHNSGTPESFQKLIDLTGSEATQHKFDDLYASEAWPAFTGLLAIADKAAADDAFRVHFFNPNRSAIERSLNHPVMGIYPLSWAYKAVREWMRFLYENRTIPELRLGMSPAVALSTLTRAQNVAFAQSNPETLQKFLSTSGPWGSTLLMFNLLLPGDWSNVPFPMSRTIRDILRGNFGASSLGDNIGAIGAARDVRLMAESAGELGDYVWGPMAPKPGKNGQVPPWRPHPNTAALEPSTIESGQKLPGLIGLAPLDSAH